MNYFYALRHCTVITVIISFTPFLNDGKSLLYLRWAIRRLVCLQNEIYLDETHGSMHLNKKDVKDVSL